MSGKRTGNSSAKTGVMVPDLMFTPWPKSPLEPIPTVEYVRPCERIEEEADEGSENGRLTIRQRYAALTELLPLMGGSAMTRRASGELVIIAVLRQEAPWFETVIASIECQLELQLTVGRPWVSFRPILLLGDPGVGKSWFLRRLAELAGCGHGTVDLAGTIDAGIIAGNPPGWTATQPSFPALIINQTRTANPCCVVEEVDKAGGSERYGDPISALLSLIEPGSAVANYDKCLLAEIDVSHVNWAFTANAITPRLPKPFLSRLEIIEVPPPSLAMFEPILDVLVASLVRRWRLPAAMAPVLPAAAIRTLRADFVRYRSIRRLSQMVERVAGLCLPERQLH